MHIATFDEDLINLRDFSERLLKFIEVERHFVDGSLVVGLSSKYGSGKSTFFRMWKHDLEAKESAEFRVIVVSLNAWECDYIGDPLFSIISALVGRIQKSGDDLSAIVSAAKDLGWLATAVGGQMVTKIIGIDPLAAGEFAEKKKSSRAGQPAVPMDAFSVYQARESAMKKLKSALEKFISESDSRIIFLVDELDRCRPDFAISYLETIKHIFDLPSATFVLAADRRHLENSARTAFGPDLDFDEYYRKFVHREVNLPPISESSYKKFAEKYTTYFLEREDIRICFLGMDYHKIEYISELITKMNLSPRQIQECFRLLGHVLSTGPDMRGKLLWYLGVASIAMSAFRIGRPLIYQKLGSQTLTTDEAIRFLTNDLQVKNVEWWFTLFATGRGIFLQKNQRILDIIKDAGFASDDTKTSYGYYQNGMWGDDWGNSFESRFIETHKKIEEIMQW